MSEFTQRCKKAVEELGNLSMKYLAVKNVSEYNRLQGKIEGVKLAESYAENELAAQDAQIAELREWLENYRERLGKVERK